MINDLIIIVILLFLSAFFSSSEIAFVVSNKIKIELRARKGNFYAKSAYYLIKNPGLFFSTILISNNIVNIAFASIASYTLLSYFNLNEFEILIISTALILFFGELIPKYIGTDLADLVILVSSVPIRIILFFIYPITKVLSKISSVINRINKVEENNIMNIVDREDIYELIEESTQAKKIDEDQSDIISKIIGIKEQKVYEAMTPRTDIVGVDINSSIDEVLDKFVESGYSKLIVYEENLDNIKGIVFMKDIFRMPEDLKSIIRDVEFVPETKKSLDMLNEFLDKQFSIAVVVDEFGGTAGIVTVEDLIEELFGEISDEYDIEEKIVKQINKNTFILSGKVEIDYLNDEYSFGIEKGGYETIAGYITSKLGRIPLKGESFKIDHFIILILKSSKTKIDLIKITVELEMRE